MSYKPKILLFDIENSRSTGKFFGKVYETSILRITEPCYILSVAYCWWPDKQVKVIALPDFKGYKRGNDCEYELLEAVWKLLDEADIVVAQNGNAFDHKMINSRFAFHRMHPPSKYIKVDTLSQLKSAFNLPSNKLDFVCDYFGIGRKLPHQGEQMWEDCENGETKKAWPMMKKYNAHDVYPLLYNLYKLLLPWAKQPNLNLLTGKSACPACGSSHIHSKGDEASYGRIYKRMKCLNCGANSKDWGEKQNQIISVRPA